MDNNEYETYLRAVLALHGLDLSAQQMQRVVAVFQRNAEIAKLVVDVDLSEHYEVAPRFEP